MLARLSIRDIVLIDRLDIDFVSGLSVLTGETGAGKSILLDAFALALGALVDAATHRGLLDAYGRLEDDAVAVEKLWNARRDAEDAVAKHRAEIERAAREADWLRHAVEELQK